LQSKGQEEQDSLREDCSYRPSPYRQDRNAAAAAPFTSSTAAAGQASPQLDNRSEISQQLEELKKKRKEEVTSFFISPSGLLFLG